MNTLTPMTRTHRRILKCLLTASCMAVIGCNPSTPTSSEPPETPENSLEAQIGQQLGAEEQAAPSPALILELEAKLLNAATQVSSLNTATKTFLASPSEQAHTDLLEAYQQAHQSYRLGATVLFLASGENASNLMIDAFPMLPGYLDSVEGYPSSGLIHSELSIDLKTLEDEHQFSDQLYLTLGFHPYEFILTGDPSSPIAAWRRFAIEGTKKQKIAAQRRSDYLALLANHLQKDIQQQVLWWQKSKPVRLAFLNDQRIMEGYLKEEKEHTGDAGAERIKDFWLSLDALQTSAEIAKTEEVPEKTLPSDSSSQE